MTGIALNYAGRWYPRLIEVPGRSRKHEEFGEKAKKEVTIIDAQIQELIPEPLLNFGTKGSKDGYVKTPKQLLPFLDDSGNPLDGSDRVRMLNLFQLRMRKVTIPSIPKKEQWYTSVVEYRFSTRKPWNMLH